MAEPARIESVPIPEELRLLLLVRITEQQLAVWGAEALLVEAVREHVLSRQKAATLLGLDDLESREAFFERHSLSNEYSLEMVEEDFETIDQAHL